MLYLCTALAKPCQTSHTGAPLAAAVTGPPGAKPCTLPTTDPRPQSEARWQRREKGCLRSDWTTRLHIRGALSYCVYPFPPPVTILTHLTPAAQSVRRAVIGSSLPCYCDCCLALLRGRPAPAEEGRGPLTLCPSPTPQQSPRMQSHRGAGAIDQPPASGSGSLGLNGYEF
jgi:hypothetical protein